VSVAFVRGWIRTRRDLRLAARNRPSAIEAARSDGDAP